MGVLRRYPDSSIPSHEKAVLGHLWPSFAARRGGRISRQGRLVRASRWGKQSAWLSAPHVKNRAVARTHFRKEKGMQNTRKRAETLTIRLTKAEKEMIQKKAKKAQLSITDFLVATSLRTEIHVAEDVKPLLVELKRIGNNINQITMKINAGAFHSADFSEVIQGQRMIFEQLLRIAGGR